MRAWFGLSAVFLSPFPISLPRLLRAALALLLLTGATAVAQAESSSSIVPVQLKTDALVNPMGVDTLQPQFSWQLAPVVPEARGLGQTGYRILVASSLEKLGRQRGDVWDSGRINSSNQLGIACACRSLQPVRSYYWKVMTWDRSGHGSEWSEPANWGTGLLSPANWKAHWIAAAPDPAAPAAVQEGRDLPEAQPQPLPIFRRDLAIAKPVAEAIVAVSGLGQYELRVNGKNVTPSVMNPGWTDYRKRVFYNMYDIRSLLTSGRNALGVMLGNGMYDSQNIPGRYNKFTGSYGQPKLILQLTIRFQDGSVTTVVTDSTWTTTPGPITLSSIYGGEDEDARREQTGWDRAGFEGKGWTPAVEVAGPGGALVAQELPPIIVARTFTPVRSQQFPDGAIVYDLGKNFSGWPNIVVQGEPGSRVKILDGELLDSSGHVTERSMNAQPDFDNEFNYTLRGGAPESWHPRFSYNGFRYLEVKPSPAQPGGTLPQIRLVYGSFLHDDVAVTGDFASSDTLLVQIHRLIDQAILSNMFSVLTDCPTREKLGWLEQTHLNATSIMYNYDALGLYKKMADDMADAQLPSGLSPSTAPELIAFVDGEGKSTVFRDTPEWGSAVILSPMAAYRFYGDASLLAAHYDSMQRYSNYLASKTKENILAYGLGDWYDIGPGEPGFSKLTSIGLTATAIYYQDLLSMAEIARILNKPQDAQRYTQSASAVRDAFNQKFFHPEAGSYDHGSQTAQAMPLALGLVPEAGRAAVLSSLVADIRNHDNHITAGDIGYHYVVRALSDNGRSDVLADMLARTDSPSYGYQLKQGATSLTEAWDANPKDSQNHFMLGQAEEWFYRTLSGLDIDMTRAEAARILIHPTVLDSIDSASASEQTVFGQARSAWKKSDGGMAFNLIIPCGQQATVILPVAATQELTEGGRAVAPGEAILSVDRNKDSVHMILGSGTYNFAVGH